MKTNNKGIALFISIGLMFLLSVGVIVVLLTAYNYTNVTEQQIKRIRALTLAEAGIHYAYWKLGPNTDDPDYSTTYIDEASADTINPDASGYDVKIWIESDVDNDRDVIKSKVEY